MIPREKAFQLVSDLCKNDCTIKNINKNKKIAINIVNNIIKGYIDFMDYLNCEFKQKNKLFLNYWEKVKQEIENL